MQHRITYSTKLDEQFIIKLSKSYRGSVAEDSSFICTKRAEM